jgi:hypothetical protein
MSCHTIIDSDLRKEKSFREVKIESTGGGDIHRLLFLIFQVYMEPLKKVQVEGYIMFAEPEVLFGNLDELCAVSLFCQNIFNFSFKIVSSITLSFLGDLRLLQGVRPPSVCVRWPRWRVACFPGDAAPL